MDDQERNSGSFLIALGANYIRSGSDLLLCIILHLWEVQYLWEMHCDIDSQNKICLFLRFENGGTGFFGSTFTRTEPSTKDPFGESRQITCKKCGNFHVWFLTNKSKSRARWCQECKDFHQAKDGDGWVEQSSQPLLFGILQKVDAPCAYVCADSKIFDATEWYICQEMRSLVNTHKPSFQVNTSATMKHGSSGKGTSSGQRGGGMPPPPPNMEEATKEEFVEWLQNAVQAGLFENFGGGSDNPFADAGTGSSSKSGGSSVSKHKKKGKKHW